MRHTQLRPLLLASTLIIALAVFLPQAISQAEVTEGEWLAEYYNNPLLAGEVVAEETLPGPFLEQTWDANASPIEGVAASEFSVRFSTLVTFEDANYNFKLSADDGARMYLNGALIIDAWEEPNQAQDFFASRVLGVDAGTYTVTVEYYELYDIRQVEARWELTEDDPAQNDGDFEVPGSDDTPDTGDDGTGDDTPTDDPDDTDDSVDIPAGSTGPSDPTAPYDAWRVRYYSNPILEGQPVASEEIPTADAKIEVEWAPGASPAENVPHNEWSARYTLNIRVPEATNYKFILTADDGARVWINGAEVINAFDEGERAQTYFKSRVIPVPAGTYTITIDYFELYGLRQMEMQATPTDDLPAQGDETFVIPGSSGPVGGGGGGDIDDGGDVGDGGQDSPDVEGFIVDQFDGQFIWSGAQEWRTAVDLDAVNGSYIYTDSSQLSFLMYGRWNLFFEETGNYEVRVYIPEHDGDVTNAARYRVFHAGVLSDPIIIDQDANEGSWVSLGTYTFENGGSQFVYLNDLTFEASTTDVLFDAVQIVP